MATNLHLVMHGVAIKKHGNPAAIASVSGLAESIVGETLEHAETSGRVVSSDGKYMLSPAGQQILLGEYSRFYSDLRDNTGFVSAYEKFETVNTELKQVITDWQTMDVGGEKVPNDHSNSDYDDKVIDRLGNLHERFEPILNNLISIESRLGYYRDKLTAALDQADDGAIEWVSDATLDSYHTVWFELHEDLLRLLGREREEN